MDITIVKARSNDRADIFQFIREHWRADHIFIRDPNFFDYEMMKQGRPQFIIAKDQDDVVGVIGYLQYSENLQTSDLFLVIFRVLEAYSSEGIGIKLLQYVNEMTSKTVSTVGANPKALPLYQLLGFRIGYLEHFYWINPQISTFKIAVANSTDSLDCDTIGYCRPLANDEINSSLFESIDQDNIIQKSYWYFVKRYLQHPHYKYELFGVFDEFEKSPKLTGIGIVRIVECNGSRVVRIVDWLGKDQFFLSFATAVQSLCLDLAGEYVDFYCHGLDVSDFENYGFFKNDGKDIIPNYFAPFEAKNIAISYSTTGTGKLRLFRGDGDQDRPA